MASRPIPKHYIPANPEKYIGSFPIVSRSSWEWNFMEYCDHHPDIIKWVSEPTDFGSGRGGIPYRDPVTGKQKIYIPDFLVHVFHKNRGVEIKLIEIKPMKETYGNYANTRFDASMVARNDAKWAAARAWGMRHGIEFVILTEADIFTGAANKMARASPVKPYTAEHTKVTKKNTPRTKTARASKTKSTTRRTSTRSTGKAAKAGKVSRARKTRKA